MWTDLERELDGMMGRMLSWLAHPPAHQGTLSSAVEDVEEDPASRRDGADEPAPAVARAVVEKTAKRAREATADPKPDSKATTAPDLEPEPEAEPEAAPAPEAEAAPGRAAEDGPDEPDGLERKLLIALAAAPKGASMKKLQQATGGGAYAARQSLNRLIRQGRVARKGKGMRTHYQLKGQ